MVAAEHFYANQDQAEAITSKIGGEVDPTLAWRFGARPYRMDVHGDVVCIQEPNLGAFGLIQTEEPDKSEDAPYAYRQAVDDIANSFDPNDPETSMRYTMGYINEAARERGQKFSAVLTKVFQDGEGNTKVVIGSAGGAHAFLYPRNVDRGHWARSFVGNLMTGSGIRDISLDGSDEAMDTGVDVRVIDIKPGDRIALVSNSLFYNPNQGGGPITGDQHMQASPANLSDNDTELRDLDTAGQALLRGPAAPRDKVALIWEMADEGQGGRFNPVPLIVPPEGAGKQDDDDYAEIVDVEPEISASRTRDRRLDEEGVYERPDQPDIIDAEIVEEGPKYGAGVDADPVNPALFPVPVGARPRTGGGPRVTPIPTMSRPYTKNYPPGKEPPGWQHPVGMFKHYWEKRRQARNEKGSKGAVAAALGGVAVGYAASKKWLNSGYASTKDWMTSWNDPRRRMAAIRDRRERERANKLSWYDRANGWALVGLASLGTLAMARREKYHRNHFRDPIYRDRTIWSDDELIHRDLEQRRARRTGLLLGGAALTFIAGKYFHTDIWPSHIPLWPGGPDIGDGDGIDLTPWHGTTSAHAYSHGDMRDGGFMGWFLDDDTPTLPNPHHHGAGNPVTDLPPAPRPNTDLPSQTPSTTPGTGPGPGNTPPAPVWHPETHQVRPGSLYTTTIEGIFHDMGHHQVGESHFTGSGAHKAFVEFREYAHQKGYGDDFILINGHDGTYALHDGDVGLTGDGTMQFASQDLENKAHELIAEYAS